jgi:hypothetical protein
MTTKVIAASLELSSIQLIVVRHGAGPEEGRQLIIWKSHSKFTASDGTFGQAG